MFYAKPVDAKLFNAYRKNKYFIESLLSVCFAVEAKHFASFCFNQFLMYKSLQDLDIGWL